MIYWSWVGDSPMNSEFTQTWLKYTGESSRKSWRPGLMGERHQVSISCCWSTILLPIKVRLIFEVWRYVCLVTRDLCKINNAANMCYLKNPPRSWMYCKCYHFDIVHFKHRHGHVEHQMYALHGIITSHLDIFSYIVHQVFSLCLMTL